MIHRIAVSQQQTWIGQCPWLMVLARMPLRYCWDDLSISVAILTSCTSIPNDRSVALSGVLSLAFWHPCDFDLCSYSSLGGPGLDDMAT